MPEMTSLKTSDFDYDLPQELIAREPSAQRDACRLLVLPPGEESVQHRVFSNLTEYLQAGDLLVINDTRVLQARLIGKRQPGGGQAELLLLEPAPEDDSDDAAEVSSGRLPTSWWCLARPGKKLQEGAVIDLGGGTEAVVQEVGGEGLRRVQFRLSDGVADLQAFLEQQGHPPLPPYILAARKQLEDDKTFSRPDDAAMYQTVFADKGLSVAAPTAGLHLTDELLQVLQNQGVGIARLRLDVGAGTFKPVTEDDPTKHDIHEENFWISEETAEAVTQAKVRALESAADASGRVKAGAASTRLMILPGYEFRCVDGLITNFHLPRSTLLMLVAALVGRDRILAAYNEAVRQKYRFYSFGDAMLLWRKQKK
jgi:S-adenosylmethionine:tRNA ribosyltransferase-isomerase